MSWPEVDGELLSVVWVRHGLRHSVKAPTGPLRCDVLGKVGVLLGLVEAIAAGAKPCLACFPGEKGRRAGLL